jgi:Lon protease-like protein
VLFPGGRLPLRLFEQRYLEMAKVCLKDNAPFGVCLIEQGKEVGEPALPMKVGCLARIAEWDMPQLGVLQVEADAPVPENNRFVKLLARVMEQHPELLERPHRLESSTWVSARLAELLPLPLEAKQALLETDDGRERLAKLDALVGTEPNKV